MINVITGLPRSGSTLMCNVLNQNPKFYATSTSDLPIHLSQITQAWTNSVDVKNELNQDRKGTEEKMERTMRAYIEAWHKSERLVFDKSRGWSNNILMLQKLYPESKAIVMIRDLRNVFASIEKQHRKFPLLDEAHDMQSKTLFTRADQMFSPQGIIGGPLVGIEDILRRKHKNVMFVKCEELTSAPKTTLEAIYTFLQQELFEHDTKNVVNTATDPDGFYLYKYPHEGNGEITPLNKDEWKEYVSEDLSKTIQDRFAFYNSHFGY